MPLEYVAHFHASNELNRRKWSLIRKDLALLYDIDIEQVVVGSSGTLDENTRVCVYPDFKHKFGGVDLRISKEAFEFIAKRSDRIKLFGFDNRVLEGLKNLIPINLISPNELYSEVFQENIDEFSGRTLNPDGIRKGFMGGKSICSERLSEQNQSTTCAVLEAAIKEYGDKLYIPGEEFIHLPKLPKDQNVLDIVQSFALRHSDVNDITVILGGSVGKQGMIPSVTYKREDYVIPEIPRPRTFESFSDLGLGVEINNGELTITSIEHNSPFKNQIKKGDAVSNIFFWEFVNIDDVGQYGFSKYAGKQSYIKIEGEDIEEIEKKIKEKKAFKIILGIKNTRRNVGPAISFDIKKYQMIIEKRNEKIRNSQALFGTGITFIDPKKLWNDGKSTKLLLFVENSDSDLRTVDLDKLKIRTEVLSDISKRNNLVSLNDLPWPDIK